LLRYRSLRKGKITPTSATKKSKSKRQEYPDFDDDADLAGTPPKRKSTPSKLSDSYVLQVADLATLEGLCRAATHDFAPHATPRKQFMYWSAKLPSSACMMLIQRYKRDVRDVMSDVRDVM
jgi:hypothetical protein